MNNKPITDHIDLGRGIEGTEYRKGTCPLLLYTVLKHASWPTDIILQRDRTVGIEMYLITSEYQLPKGVEGRYQYPAMAYEAILEHMNEEALKGFKWVKKEEPQPTLLEKLEIEEQEQEPIATWEESYRVGLCYVHESRLRDGSNMAIFEVKEPSTLRLRSIKPRTESHYMLNGEEVPYLLKGQKFTTVRAMAQAVSDHVAIEAMV